VTALMTVVMAGYCQPCVVCITLQTYSPSLNAAIVLQDPDIVSMKSQRSLAAFQNYVNLHFVQ